MTHETSAGENARTDRDAPHDKKPDAAVLGRGETRVPDEDAVILADGGRDLPRFVYDDAAISTGDIVVDLASGKALQVVGKSVQTVGEHPQTRSDDTAEMFGAHSAETVFDCVFLPDGEKVTPPTKTYAYPESRLLRYPVENATEYGGDIQTWLRTAFLDELANAAAENDRLTAAVSIAVREAYGEDLEATFRELIEAKRDEAEVATDGGADLLSADLKAALEASECHPDMVRYAEAAAERGGTPILNSLRHFHEQTDVSRIADIGTEIEKTLWHHGARATLDRHGHLDDTNTAILEDIADDHGEALLADGGTVQTGPEPRPDAPSKPTPDVTRIEAVGSAPDTVDRLTVTVHFYDGCTEHTAHVEFTVKGSTAAFRDIDVPCSMRAAAPAIVEAEAAVGEHHAIQAVETAAMQLAEALADLADGTEGDR